jgi:hypothetical protein
MLACPHLQLARFEACLRHPNALRWRELGCRSKGSARVPGLFFRSVFYLQIETKGRADERTRTADLISLRVISQALQGLARTCKSPILSGFLFSSLPWVAPYCVPGGIRVVSTEAQLFHNPAHARIRSMSSTSPVPS